MKPHLRLLLMQFLCVSCINNPLDSKHEDHNKHDSPLRTLLTKTSSTFQEDTLTMMSKTQKDVDYLMMNRVIFKDSIFVLSIKRQDAIFLGVPEDVYERYAEYVLKLNENVANK